MPSTSNFSTEDLLEIFFQKYMEDEKNYSVSLDDQFIVEINKKYKARFKIKDLQAIFRVCIDKGLITHKFLSNPLYTGMVLTKEGIYISSQIHEERKKAKESDFIKKLSAYIDERKGFFNLVLVITAIGTFLVSYYALFK